MDEGVAVRRKQNFRRLEESWRKIIGLGSGSMEEDDWSMEWEPAGR